MRFERKHTFKKIKLGANDTKQAKRGKNTTRDEKKKKKQGNRDLRGFKSLIGTTTIERQSGNG